MYQMMESVNTVVQKVDGTGLSEVHLRETFEVWWPRLEARLTSLPAAASTAASIFEPEQPESNDKEMLIELLHLVRTMQPETESRSRFQPLRGAAHPGALARLLSDEGISVKDVTITPTLTVVHAKEVPQPLQDQVYDLISAYAKEVQSKVSIDDENGRVVEFEKSGWSDEPPF